MTAATQQLADGDFATCLVSIAAAERLQGQTAAALQQMAVICRIHIYAADGAWHEVWQLTVVITFQSANAKPFHDGHSGIVAVLTKLHVSSCPHKL